MELSEAKQILDVTSEERNSIDNYLNYKHLRINMLADFTPKAYREVSHICDWSGGEKYLREDIEDFVNLYSAMYKTSQKKSLKDSIGYTESRNLYRGTSLERAKALIGTAKQFISMTKDETVAKAFCENGKTGTLLKMEVASGVPFLNVDDYRDPNRRDEKEVILAPFVKVAKREEFSTRGDFNYCYFTVYNPGVRHISDEEMKDLEEDVYDGFEQNLDDIKEYERQIGRLESHKVSLSRTWDDDDIEFLKEKIEEDEILVAEFKSKTSSYTEKLQRYLQGRCAQKVKEIYEAKRMVEQAKKDAEERAKQEEIARREAEQKRLEEERIAREKAEIEERRKSSITELGSRLRNEPVESNRITYQISDTYNRMLHNESNVLQIARSLGINFQPQTRVESLGNIINDITLNITNIENELQGATVQEDMTQEAIDEETKKYSPYLDGISYAGHILQDNPNFAQIHANQLEHELKRSLYLRANQVIKNAKLGKLNFERETIQSEKVGFFGKLLGKDELKDEKIRNIDLKAEAIMTEIPEEKERYSVKDILADLYACAITEFDGNFTPEMLTLYNNITNTFGSKGQNGQLKSFSQEYILKLAQAKINAEPGRNILAVAGNGTKRVSEIERLRAENGSLQQQIATNKMKNGSLRYSPNRGNDAVRMFSEKLNGVRAATKKLLEPRSKEEMQQTVDLWGDQDK